MLPSHYLRPVALTLVASTGASTSGRARPRDSYEAALCFDHVTPPGLTDFSASLGIPGALLLIALPISARARSRSTSPAARVPTEHVSNYQLPRSPDRRGWPLLLSFLSFPFLSLSACVEFHSVSSRSSRFLRFLRFTRCTASGRDFNFFPSFSCLLTTLRVHNIFVFLSFELRIRWSRLIRRWQLRSTGTECLSSAQR